VLLYFTLLYSTERETSASACTTRSARGLPRTSDASVGRFEVGGEVALARVYVDEVAHADAARPSTGAVRVEERDDVRRTADVVVASDAAPEPHPAVHGAQHQHHASRLAASRERLVHAEVASVYSN